MPYLFVDASYYKIRDGARYITKAPLVTASVRDNGFRENLGARITDCENEAFWARIFKGLKERGLAGGSTGRLRWPYQHPEGAEAAFLGTSWQVCQVYCSRAVLKNTPKKYQKEAAESLKKAYANEQWLQDLADDLNIRGYRKAANPIERFLPGLIVIPRFRNSTRNGSEPRIGWKESTRN